MATACNPERRPVGHASMLIYTIGRTYPLELFQSEMQSARVRIVDGPMSVRAYEQLMDETEIRETGILYKCLPGQHDDLGISRAVLASAAQHPHLPNWIGSGLLRYADECDAGRDWPDCVASAAADALEKFTSAAADERLLELGRQLDAATAEQVRLDDEPNANGHEEAYARTSGIVGEIETTPAMTMAGLKVKAAAVA
jgi:hypothetical protein